uniref:Chromosome 12 open reading frame 10 n=1 Tax=Eptatretus burgeri TaxID=7764 RepID=A0A8C4QIM9_EPTBU
MNTRGVWHLMAMSRVCIGTHSGTFHCDELLACSLLRCLPRYRDAEIVRTRDPELLAACDVVVDVGAEYDPSRHRYDHHQRDFSESMNSLWPSKPWKTKLSSAGLIFLHFGEQVLASILEVSPKDLRLPTLFNKVTSITLAFSHGFLKRKMVLSNCGSGVPPSPRPPPTCLKTANDGRPVDAVRNQRKWRQLTEIPEYFNGNL